MRCGRADGPCVVDTCPSVPRHVSSHEPVVSTKARASGDSMQPPAVVPIVAATGERNSSFLPRAGDAMIASLPTQEARRCRLFDTRRLDRQTQTDDASRGDGYKPSFMDLAPKRTAKQPPSHSMLKRPAAQLMVADKSPYHERQVSLTFKSPHRTRLLTATAATVWTCL